MVALFIISIICSKANKTYITGFFYAEVNKVMISVGVVALIRFVRPQRSIE